MGFACDEVISMRRHEPENDEIKLVQLQVKIRTQVLIGNLYTVQSSSGVGKGTYMCVHKAVADDGRFQM